jgi:ElaB/YqjD/DUF883 family membrane-anchored ribosome-binding protein
MNTTELNMERIRTDLKRIVRDSEALLHDSGEVLGDKAREAHARLAETLESAKSLCGRMNEKAREQLQTTDRVIRQHPYKSIGIAAGIGLLVGILATRK